MRIPGDPRVPVEQRVLGIIMMGVGIGIAVIGLMEIVGVWR